MSEFRAIDRSSLRPGDLPMPRIAYPFRSILLHACLALSVFAPMASAQNAFVGPASDPDCDYHTIQDAVDAWAASPSTDFLSVYIVNSQAYPATAISIPTPVASTGISLTGNYPACHLAVAGGHAVLDGSGNGNLPVLDIEGSVAGDARRFQVTLAQLDITGGNHIGGNGGGVRLRGNAVLTIFETDIHGNTAAKGGGIAVETTASGTPNLIMVGNQEPAVVQDNHATQDGGGMYCANASLYCDRYCLIAGNTAGGNGGGVAQQDCGTSINPSRSSGTPDPNIGLRLNTASGNGGGAWVSGGFFSLGGNAPLRLAPVVGNIAGGSGGGLYFTGLGSSSNQQRAVQFDDNRAGVDGGALYADSGFLQLDASLGAGCGGDVEGCARFRGNHAAAVGGALALSGTADALMWNVMFAGNDAAHASVMQIGGSGAGATLIDAHVAGNHGAPELLRSSGGFFDLRYVTIADNGADDSALIRFDAPGGLAASNSLLYDANGASTGLVVATPVGTTYNVDCVLVHEDSALAGQANVTNVVVADPQWDTTGVYPPGLYVPGPDSLAVDACGPGSGTIPDLLGVARPQDLPKPDGAGTYDMGAIERLPDRIFGDGFEQP
jgi:predicted outer membrane repeat protein